MFLPLRAFPPSSVITGKVLPEQRITRAIRGPVWIGCSLNFFPALPTAFLMGNLKPPPGRASCQDGFRDAEPPSFACLDAQVPRHSAALFAVPSGRDGRGRKRKEGDQPCLTPNQPKAPPRNPQPTSPTRYATATDRRASGRESDAYGHTPPARDSTYSSTVCRSTDGSPPASPLKRKTNATGRVLR